MPRYDGDIRTWECRRVGLEKRFSCGDGGVDETCHLMTACGEEEKEENYARVDQRDTGIARSYCCYAIDPVNLFRLDESMDPHFPRNCHIRQPKIR